MEVDVVVINSDNVLHVTFLWIKCSIQVFCTLALIGVSAGAVQPNLKPYQPSGWSDKIVVSKTTGTHEDSSPLYATDTLYVDWAVINNGAGATTARFFTEIYVDGDEAPRMTWYTDSPLNPNVSASVDDYAIGTLSAGTHTIKIKTDSTNAIAESVESVLTTRL